MRKIKYWLIYNLLCPLAVWLLRGYKVLSGYRNNSWDRSVALQLQRPGIYVLFHSSLFYAALLMLDMKQRGLQVTVELSPSRDGEIAARILRRLGVRVVRGSGAKRPVAAARTLLRELAAGHNVGVALDGPRGPKGKVSSTVLGIARKTGAPLSAFYGRARREWQLKSWDRCRIPKPFGGAEVVFLDPIIVPPDADEAWMAELRRRLRAEMNEIPHPDADL